VLGWGGYWAWDPVENAAFMPWLPATAFLHSIQSYGMLIIMALVLLGIPSYFYEPVIYVLRSFLIA